jgi:hypothetical protein
MQKIILTKAEYTTLAAVDGMQTQPTMPAALQKRLSLLGLIERRQWPKGPLWRSAIGDRYVRRGPTLNN